MSDRAVRTGRPELDGAVFVLGKGGVGKSVISEGLAALSAEQGRRTLLVRIGESLHGASQKAAMPTMSRHAYEFVDIEARHAMDEYVRHVVRLPPLVERITASEIYRKFFAAAPGLPELVLLGRIRAYSTEIRDGALRFETLVVDCPSSGHGLLMLETPFAAFRAVSVGPFARLASQIIEWLRTRVHIALVAVPEEMAVVEAIEFQNDLLHKTGLRPGIVILNRMRQESISPAARRALADVDAPQGSSDRRLLDCGALVQRRTRLEAFHHRRLAKGLGLTPLLVGELQNTRPSTVAAELRDLEP